MSKRRSSPYPDIGRSSLSSSRRTHSPLVWFFKHKVGLFRRLPENILTELAQAATLRNYGKGQFVCRTGDPAREIWIVHQGRIFVNQCGWKGNRLSLEIMVPGDVSGLGAVAFQTYPGEVQAMSDTVLIVIPRQVMVDAIERHPQLAREVFYAYAQRLHYIETLLMLSRENVEKRLLAALLYLYHKFGFVIPLTRAEIGTMAGTTTETTIRLLKRLEGKNILEKASARRRLVIRDLLLLKKRFDGSAMSDSEIDLNAQRLLSGNGR